MAEPNATVPPELFRARRRAAAFARAGYRCRGCRRHLRDLRPLEQLVVRLGEVRCSTCLRRRPVQVHVHTDPLPPVVLEVPVNGGRPGGVVLGR